VCVWVNSALHHPSFTFTPQRGQKSSQIVVKRKKRNERTERYNARLEESEHDSRRLPATTRSERGCGIESSEFHRPFVPNPVSSLRGLRRAVLRIRETKRNDIGIGGGHARTECAHEKEARRGLAIDVGQRDAETTRTESLARPRRRSPGAVSARSERTFFDINE